MPSRISYSTMRIPLPEGNSIAVLRRELFDIRAQAMAEDTQEDQAMPLGLEKDDIKANIYEGGFKTWECAIDLARIVAAGSSAILQRDHERVHCIELGCGTAIPSITLFQRFLASPLNRSVHMTLADYNSDVLRLATLPNLVLSWAGLFHSDLLSSSDGDLDITPDLLDEFVSGLQRRNMQLDFISGAWSEEFLDTIIMPPKNAAVLVLASETIYSPSTLQPFTNVLMRLLSYGEHGRHSSREAFVAAKKIYFGVGGGVDEFVRVLAQMGGTAREIPLTWEEERGVARTVMEVRAM